MTYKVTDEELSAYGLDDPELSVSVDYTDDGTSDTFVLHISRDPAEKKSAADAEDEEASNITAYARVGDSKIIYQISDSSYRSLMAAGYNDLRHQEIFSGDFDFVLSGGLAEDSLLAVDVAGVTAQAPCGTLTMDRLKVSPLGLQWSYHYDENAVQAAAAENGRDAVALVTADSGEVVEFSDIAIPDTELLLVLKDGTQVRLPAASARATAAGWSRAASSPGLWICLKRTICCGERRTSPSTERGIASWGRPEAAPDFFDKSFTP